MSDDLIPIYIKNLVGKTQRIWIDKRAPITTIHWPILSAFGVTHDQQRLIYCGVQLRLENTFDVYNVYKEAFIHVVARLRGTDGNYANIYRDMDIGKKYITPVEVQMKHLKLEIHSNFPKDLKGAWSASINYDREAYMTEAPPKTKKPKKQKDLPKDWEKQARNVMPETLKSLGYDQKNIDLVIKTLNPVDAQVAVTWLQKNAIIDKIQDLAPLFEKYPDVLAEHLLKYFTLAERVKLSTVSKTFNKMTRSPLAWKNLVLVSDWMDMTDKSFTKTMKEYGHSIERLSIQRCCYLTPNATKLIGDHCPNLKEIYGGDCPSMTSAVIEHIFSKCLKLEVVDLRFMAPGIPFAVEKVPSVKNLPNLRVLNLANRIYAENSEISSSSLKILVIKDSFTEGGYSSLKINCPNLTHMLTSNDKHKVSDSLKKTVSVNQPSHGITVHTYSGSGCGDFFTPKVMTKEEVKAIINYEVDDGTTLWICK